MEINFGQNWRTNLNLARWRYETDWNITVPIKNIQWQYFSYILCTFDEDRSVSQDIRRIEPATFWTNRKKLAYLTKYLRKYWPIFTKFLVLV